METFRVLLGISLFLYLWAWWQYAEEWLTPIGFHLPGPGFKVAPVAPLLPPAALPWFGMALFGSLVAWIIGWNTRWMSWVVLGFTIYVTLADYLTAFTLNKLFIVSLAVLALSVRGTYWSVDNRPPAPQSAWPLRILQATLLIQYGTAGWCKILHGDWLQDPSVLWSQVQGVYRTEFASWLLHTLPLGVWSLMQYASLTFELTAPLLFLSKRLRPMALVWGIAFQMMVAMTMHLLIYFSLQMLCFYVLFLNDRTVHRLRVGFGTLHEFVLGKVTFRTSRFIHTPSSPQKHGGTTEPQRRPSSTPSVSLWNFVVLWCQEIYETSSRRDVARVLCAGDSRHGQATPARWTPHGVSLGHEWGGGLLNAQTHAVS